MYTAENPLFGFKCFWDHVSEGFYMTWRNREPRAIYVWVLSQNNAKNDYALRIKDFWNILHIRFKIVIQTVILFSYLPLDTCIFCRWVAIFQKKILNYIEYLTLMKIMVLSYGYTSINPFGLLIFTDISVGRCLLS